MLDYDFFGQRPDLSARHLPGGVAPSRQALERQRYLEEKRARLDAEAGERHRQALERKAEWAAGLLGRFFRAVGFMTSAFRMNRRVLGK